MTRFTKTLFALATFAALALAAAERAEAAPLVFADRAVFAASAGTTTTADFNSAAANGGYSASLTFAGVQFAYAGPTDGSPNPGVGVVNGANFGLTNNALGINAPNVAAGTPVLTITTLPGTRSFGFDFKGSNSTQVGPATPASYAVTVAFSDGTSQTFAIANPLFNTFSFFGVTSDIDITSISIAMGAGGGQPLLDNVTFGPALAPEEVPEPATMILLGTGLAGVASLVRKRRPRARSGE